MKTILKRVIVLSAGLVIGPVCHGQVIIRAGVNTNARPARPLTAPMRPLTNRPLTFLSPASPLTNRPLTFLSPASPLTNPPLTILSPASPLTSPPLTILSPASPLTSPPLTFSGPARPLTSPPLTILSPAPMIPNPALTLPGTRILTSPARPPANPAQTPTGAAQTPAVPVRTFTGTVYDPSGMPAPGVRLQVVPLSGVLNIQIESDANGKYAISWHPMPTNGSSPRPRVYSLIARDLRRNFAAVHTIDESITNLDIDLQLGLTISATLQEPGGKPITNAVTSLIIYSGTMGSQIAMPSVRPDARGVIQIPALPQGCRYSVGFRAPGYGSPAAATIPEADSRTTSLVLPAIVLKPADRLLQGVALGPDGLPAAGATVQISGAGQPNTSARADANGKFAVKVCEGPIRVSGNMKTSNGQSVSGNVQAQGGDKDVILKLAPMGGPAAVPRLNGQLPANPTPAAGPLL